MKFSLTKNPESEFFYKEYKSHKKKNSGRWEGVEMCLPGLKVS